MIARLCHRAEKPVQRLAAAAAEDHDHERTVFFGRRLLDFIEHGATDRLFRWQDFVRDISNRQVTLSGLLGEPDVFSYRTSSNRRFSGC